MLGIFVTFIVAVIFCIISYVGWVYWANNTYRGSEERIKGLCVTRYRSNPANFNKIKTSGGDTIAKTIVISPNFSKVTVTLNQLDKNGKKVDEMLLTYNLVLQSDSKVILPFPPADKLDYTTIYF